jgi:hypothetical protein
MSEISRVPPVDERREPMVQVPVGNVGIANHSDSSVENIFAN